MDSNSDCESGMEFINIFVSSLTRVNVSSLLGTQPFLPLLSPRSRHVKRKRD